jgi:8-oxo-dGTP pyrophosphatase MutT (NUDIX family)
MNQAMDNFYAGGFLFSRARRAVFLQLRDGKTAFNPHKWGLFGGLNEGPETRVQCVVRELREETGLAIAESEARFLREYFSSDGDVQRAVFYVESEVSEAELMLGEGAGFAWIPLTALSRFDLTDNTRGDIAYFVNHVLGGK